VGTCYALLPSLVRRSHVAAFATLFASGLAQAWFAPLLAGLALGLVGHGHLNRTAGSNQAYNHLGTVSAALLALVLIRNGVAWVFYLVACIAVCAAGSALLIDRKEIDHDRATGGSSGRIAFRALLASRRVQVLIASAALFQAAYASAFPFVVLRVRQLSGSDPMVAGVVLVTQAAMTPVAVVTGRLLDAVGRKPIWGIGFVTLPVYLLLCGVVSNPWALLALQVLGSIGPGILGVAVVVVCADVARGTGRFHALTAVVQTGLAAGAFLGSIGTGFLIGHVGSRSGSP
jgi:predicted MFS family arabinose efflux permease